MVTGCFLASRRKTNRSWSPSITHETTFKNRGKDCLLTPPLYYPDKLPLAEELFKIYFIHIRAIRKDATYATLPSRKQQVELFKDSIRDGLLYLYNAAVLKNNLQGFLLTWNKLVTKGYNTTRDSLIKLKHRNFISGTLISWALLCLDR